MTPHQQNPPERGHSRDPVSISQERTCGGEATRRGRLRELAGKNQKSCKQSFWQYRTETATIGLLGYKKKQCMHVHGSDTVGICLEREN
jgi:hypothetical protein